MFKVIIKFLDGSEHSFVVYAADRNGAISIGRRRHSDLYGISAVDMVRQISECAKVVYKSLEIQHV
jgi:hypothetical protein